MAKVFKVSASPLSLFEVVGYLANPPTEFLNPLPPVKPKAGEVFLYKASEEACKGTKHDCETGFSIAWNLKFFYTRPVRRLAKA